MLAENQNNSLVEKLQNLDQIPDGFEFSSDAVWLQMETKLLQQKPSKIPMFTKYKVAASFIIAISLMAFLLIRKQGQPFRTNIASKEIPLPIKVDNKVIIAAKIEHIKNELHNYTPSKKRKIITTDSTQGISEPLLVVNEPNQNLMQQPASRITSTNSVSSTFEKKQPIVKNRLPIIHINELSQAPEPIYSKSNNKNFFLNEIEDAPLPIDHPKPWWQAKPKPTNPINSLTDNQ